MKATTILLIVLVVAQAAVFVNSQQTWGQIADWMTRRVYSRVAQSGPTIITTNQTFVTDPHVITGMRATPMNNVLGSVLPIGGGVNQTFVNFQFTGAANTGFDFRIEIFSGAITKSISLLLISAAYFFIKLVS